MVEVAKHTFTAAETASGVKASKASRKAERRLRKELATMGLSEAALTSLKDVIVELLRTANSNPLTGILVSIVAAEVLYKLKIISTVGYVALYAIIGTEVAVDEEGNVINAIAAVDKLFGNASTSTPINPSATTIVYPQASPSAATQALIETRKAAGVA